MTIDAFISHAHADAALAQKVVDFLVMGPGLTLGEIRCTSYSPTGISIGDDISKQLRKDIDQAFVFMPLITENTESSDFVMFEIGAAWGLKTTMLPMVDGFDGVNIPELLKGILICDLRQKDDRIRLGQAVNDAVYRKKERVDVQQIIAAAEKF